MLDQDIRKCDNHEKQRLFLLQSLKQTVEWLFDNRKDHVWDAYGGLTRVCSIVDSILTHGLHSQGPEKYWNFIGALRLLRPEEAPPILPSEINGKRDLAVERLQTHSWLQRSLSEHTLSRQLKALIQDVDNLKDYYNEHAFLRNRGCTKALVLCLCAIEQNSPTLLDGINSYLGKCHTSAVNKSSAMVETPILGTNLQICDFNHTPVSSISSSATYVSDAQSSRTSESPEHAFESSSGCSYGVTNSSPLVPSPKRYQNRQSKRSQKFKGRSKSERLHEKNNTVVLDHEKDLRDSCGSQPRDGTCFSWCKNHSRLRHSVSAPDMHAFSCMPLQKLNSHPNLSILKVGHWQCSSNEGSLSCNREVLRPQLNCDTTAQRPCTEQDGKSSGSCDSVTNKSVETSWKAQHSRSKSDGSAMVDEKPVLNGVCLPVDDSLSFSLPSILSNQEGQKKKSIFEGGAVVVPTECFFPRPQPGQTLTSFLSSDFNICAELDRENAHFCISEALISAIEHIKCTESLKVAAEEAESDEEIKKLTQRIRIRRRERLQEKEARNTVFWGDGRTDTTTTSQSASPMSTSHSSDFDAGDSIGSDDDEVADLDLSDHNASNLTSMKESGLSLSMASMYSDADIHKGPFQHQNADGIEKKGDLDQIGIHLSAEVVALSLLKRFSEKQLPKASDLEWLVSELDAPQRLLPLPDSWPVSPDVIDEDYDLEKTRLRGNLEWAPPRQQIIFIIHPKPIKKDAILKQDYRCAGCGMRIERSYVKKFRYCEYLGKFFCQCCHANNLTYIPGRIIWKWDFGQYYVSKFSWKFLDQMFQDPLFNLMDINPKQYRKIRQLGLCQEYRTQLFYLKDFIRTCRDSKLVLKDIEQLPEHIYNEPHLYSISDFLKVKSGEMSRHLNMVIAKCTGHVLQCILCHGKGFICELCNRSDDVIFPFQLTKVCHCGVCGSCFHKRCFKDGSCPKCVRIKERRRRLIEQKDLPHSDEEL